MRNNIAITGVGGYVGTNVRRTLSKMGVPVLCITQRSITPAANETVMSFDACLNLSALSTLSKCSAMIHLAGVGRHTGGAGYMQNVALAQSAANICLRAKIPKIVFVSGLGADTANTGYFSSKLEAEKIIRSSGIRHTIFRASYIVGRQDALVAKIRRLARKKLPIVPGDGSYIIQPIHIDDACVAIIDEALSGRRTSRTLDLVGPDRVSYKKFAGMVVGANAARSYPIQAAVRNAVCDARAAYDIDELAILLGSFGGDHATLAKRSKMTFCKLGDML